MRSLRPLSASRLGWMRSLGGAAALAKLVSALLRTSVQPCPRSITRNKNGTSPTFATLSARLGRQGLSALGLLAVRYQARDHQKTTSRSCHFQTYQSPRARRLARRPNRSAWPPPPSNTGAHPRRPGTIDFWGFSASHSKYGHLDNRRSAHLLPGRGSGWVDQNQRSSSCGHRGAPSV